MDGRNVISLSIKQCYQDLYNKVRELQPSGKTWSTFVFDIIQEWYNIKQNGLTNFFQPPASWNKQIKAMSDEEYKKFYEQLNLLIQLERVNTSERLSK